ncbi:MAG: hypothetical protein SPH62_01615, partial [Candidatus Egerieousia sp.]|nr:hypothetical protein [bacterium]MDY5255095.1 hypothetical protein [Candidatus Egerieousia sp.]
SGNLCVRGCRSAGDAPRGTMRQHREATAGGSANAESHREDAADSATAESHREEKAPILPYE